MSWLATFLQVLPSVIQLMAVAEKAFDKKPDSGAEKKQMVMGATKAMVDGLQTVSKGGQKETWNKLEAPLNGAIDAACDFLFKKDAR